MFFYLLSIFAISYDKYAIVVDAGSTKTTCYVYGYNGDKNPVQINKESLNYILYDVLLTDILKSELFGSSSPFTALVTNNIPSGNRNDCTFSLLATCLRDFPENQVDSIFSIYRDYLVSQNVWKDFKYENTSFSVLSSQMEGVLLWIAINHRAGFFSGSCTSVSVPDGVAAGGFSAACFAASSAASSSFMAAASSSSIREKRSLSST